MSAVFGTVVSREVVSRLPRYANRKINQVDLAREAIRFIQSDDKNARALSHVLDLKWQYGNGVSTHLLIYNGTGTRLTLVASRDWSGGNFKMEPPRTFENGQWIAFLHVKPPALAEGSIGARVYRATDVDGNARDFLIAWNCPWSGSQNSVLTQVGPVGSFTGRWDALYTNLRRARKIARHTLDNNFESSVTIGGLTSPEYIAVLQHKFQPLPEEL
ncbi:hypothetical protein KSS87_021865 [Heliosperma pusillum]|nr:hypothetical protein KSS87_016833 [Heliosperma pusillum]KAH9623849.1 hypothetical protein KSS87_008741 [Heliosperma pusillum]KAH9624402.1 hypothetical protein KSS87_021865 [Heliosperma pusillum]